MMRSSPSLFMLGFLACCPVVVADDSPPSQAEAKAPPAPQAPKTEEAKLLAAVRETMERNAQEIKALKEQYSKDLDEQRKKAEAQQKQIETLQRAAQALEAQLKTTKVPVAPVPAVAPAQGQAPAPAVLPAPGPAPAQGPDRQQKLTEVQEQQLKLLEEQLGLVGSELETQIPAIQQLQSQTALLNSRSTQAAERDQQIANSQNILTDSVDNMRRNGTWLPSQLKEWFSPSGNNVTPLSIWNTVSTRYEMFQGQRGAGLFQFQEYTPFFLVQLNKRILLSAETSFTQGGVALGQAQIDMFINNWLTADVGYFLAPIGYWNERLDPRWINKLPDIPLVMRQVIPDGLTMTGVQFRGAKYLFKSPVKMEYSIFASNGFGVSGAGKAADWADTANLLGSTAGVNNAMAYGGRIGFWIPNRGINFGVSELVSAPYSLASGSAYSIWQPYFNYHRGNWDFRFEYGNSYQDTRRFTGSNIERQGMYSQVAYRNYQSLHQHLQRLEYVFRFSDAFFHGINQSQLDLTSYSPLMNAPIDSNQYTIGVNYYLYASSILKLAYEINSPLHASVKDNVFMMQFATNF